MYKSNSMIHSVVKRAIKKNHQLEIIYAVPVPEFSDGTRIQ